MAVDEIVLEDAQILFLNFGGRPGEYNPSGKRMFSVLLADDVAAELDRIGWNVRILQPREEGEPQRPYLTVEVSFRNRPPNVFLITSRGRTHLGEDQLEVIDWSEIIKTDMIIRPYEWDVNGKVGIKAYLKSIYVHILEDPLELKYADLPMSDVPVPTPSYLKEEE